MDDSLNQTGDLLAQAAEALLGAAAPLTAAAQAQAAAAAAQQAAAQRPQTAQQQAQQAAAWQSAPLPLTQPAYVYQPQTPQQAAQQQAQQQQQYPPGGVPAFNPQPPAPTPMQHAQQQAQQQPPPFALPLSPGDLALERARATPLGSAQAGADGGAMGTFASALRTAASSVLLMKYAAQAVEGAFLGMAQKASPTAVGQYQGSLDLLQAKLGTAILPALEEASRAIQGVARNLPDVNRSRGVLGGLSISDVATEGLVGGVKLGNNLLGVDKPLESWAGLPMARQSSHEEAYDRLQQAALNQDPLQTEIMREQNRNLEKILGVLQDRGGRGGPGAALEVNFR